MREQDKRELRKRIKASFAVIHATKEAVMLLEKSEGAAKEEVASLIDVYFDALAKRSKDEVLNEVRELEAYMMQEEIKGELLRRRTNAFQQLQNTDANISIRFFQSMPPSEAREFLKWYLYDRIKVKSIPHYGALAIGQAPYQKDQTPAEIWLFFTNHIERPLLLDYKLRFYKEYFERGNPHQKPEQAQNKRTLRQVALMIVYNGEKFISADHETSRTRLNAFAAEYGHTSSTSGLQLFRDYFSKLTTPTDRTGAANTGRMIKDIEGILDKLTPAGRELAETDLKALRLKNS